MKHSETAFLVPRGPAEYDLRWFTPGGEVDLCGHATLASAHVLFNEDGRHSEPAAEELRFHSRSGLLLARFEEDKVVLDFPASPPVPASGLPDVRGAFGFKPDSVLVSESDYLFVVANSETEILDAAPDFDKIRQFDQHAVIITAKAEGRQYDVVSRMFAPKLTIDEDPVTGSAHCVIGPWWANVLGKQELVCYQASERGGTLRVRMVDDRVQLAGNAVTVLRGEMAE
jgi:PhzF family phenazine biosynthesis protein